MDTKSDRKAVIFEGTAEQAAVLVKALDVYTRLGIGQISIITEMINTHQIPSLPGRAVGSDQSLDLRDASYNLINKLSRLLGYSGSNHSMGIGGTAVSIDTHRAYEMQKVISQALALDHDQNPLLRGVHYDGLIVRYTRDPAPRAYVKEQSNLSSEAKVMKNTHRPE